MKNFNKIAVPVIITMVLLGACFYLLSLDIDTGQTPSFSMGHGPEGGTVIKPLTVVSCSPDTGYDYCVAEKYQYIFATAYAELQTTNLKGKSGYGMINGEYHQYYLDKVTINVKHKGDKLYVTRGASTWGSCGASGCSGSQIGAGEYVIATAPSSHPKNAYFTAWDYNSNSGYWAWVYTMWGWVGTPSTFNFYVIGCYDDGDVPEGYYCDKSGTWDTWKAKQDLCYVDGGVHILSVETICEGFDLYTKVCERETGDFVKGTLIEENSISCGCYYPDTMPNVCEGYDLYSQKLNTECVNSGLIKDSLIETNSIECGYECTEGELKTYTCTDSGIVTSAICENNHWVDNNYPSQSCPMNWINLRLILESYYQQAEDTITGWFS